MTDWTSWGRRPLVALAVAAGLLLTATGPGIATAAPTGTTGTVSGTVYWDRDDDGVRDPGEEGLAGIVVRTTTGATITDSAGTYVLAGVRSSVTLKVDAGWLRSQCLAGYSGPSGGAWATAACPDPGYGAGADQQFRVNNQFLSATVAVGGRASLGLAPDRVGLGYQPATAEPTVVDPALRLSPGFPLASPGPICQLAVCRPGEVQWVLTQWMNQGTSALSGIRSILVAPAGTRITQVRPYTGHGPGSGHSITGYRVMDATTGTAVAVGTNGVLARPVTRATVRLVGTLRPATAFLMGVGFTVDANARFSDGNQDGVADCSALTGGANSGQTCVRGTDYGPGSYIAYGAVTALAQGPDTDAELCPGIPTSCAVFGVHNKVLGGDSNDGGAWKVDSTFGPGVT